jgi:hypothetical protein
LKDDKFTTFSVNALVAASGLQLIEARLYDSTIQHVKEQHSEVPAELPSIHHAVKMCLLNPTHIEVSYSNSYIFVDYSSANREGHPLRIPVRSVTQTSGRITTFFFATASQANVIWRKGQ